MCSRGTSEQEKEKREVKRTAASSAWWLVREHSRKANVVAKAKHSRRVQRPNTESHLSVPARSTPSAAAVVRFRVARRVVATRTRRCVLRCPINAQVVKRIGKGIRKNTASANTLIVQRQRPTRTFCIIFLSLSLFLPRLLLCVDEAKEINNSSDSRRC